MQRPVSVALVVLLGLAGGLALLFRGDSEPPTGGDHRSSTVTTIRGLVDPSSAPYFADPQVRKEFAARGLRVEVETMPSAQMARSTTPDFAAYDFVFPSNLPIAEKIQKGAGAATTFSPFYSPLAIATTADVARALGEAEVARRVGGYWLLDFESYLELVADGTRWDELASRSRDGAPGQGTPRYASPTRALVTTADPRTSDSATLYVALASYVANDGAVVRSRADLRRVRPQVARLFRGMPAGPSTATAGPAADADISIGSELGVGGDRPMVAILESEFVSRYVERRKVADQTSASPSVTATPTASAAPTRSSDPIAGDTVLLYPRPTAIAKHTLVPMTARGDTLGKLLVNDGTLRGLAADLGFRTANRAAFAGVVEEQRVPAPEDMARVADTPSYDMLQNLVSAVTALE